jgi:tetratricopeptide (TPR) repeat protein
VPILREISIPRNNLLFLKIEGICAFICAKKIDGGLLMDINQNHAEIYRNLGNIFKKEGEVEKAKSCYLQLLEIDPHNAEAHKLLGNIHQLCNEIQEAIVCYCKAVEIDPNYIDAINALGSVYLIGGYPEMAMNCLNKAKALSSNPDKEEYFENACYQRLIKESASTFKIDETQSESGLDLVRTVYIGISNVCNYSHIHEKCPLHYQKEKIILPSDIVYRVLDELAEIDYQGVITFHLYNEPLADKRLFKFISYAKNKSKSLKIFILTNGYYLDQRLAKELSDYGIWKLEVSAYSGAEFERLKMIDVNIPYRVNLQTLDGRLNIYDSPHVDIKAPCYLPVTDVTINCNGDILLCCLDWKGQHTFGNLFNDSILTILQNRQRSAIYESLKKGERSFPLCKRCTFFSV